MIIFRHNPHSIWTNPIHFIACGFGIGTLPLMPGTFATLAAIPLYLWLSTLPWSFYLAIIVLMNIAGVYLCGKTNRDFGTDDHPAAVWDEIATFPLAMFLVPPTWYFILLGFLLFRLFDIWKPWPIGWVDKNVHGGFGVMLDDILAALATWIILQSVIWLL